MSQERIDRRALLSTLSSVGFASIAGCSGEVSTTETAGSEPTVTQTVTQTATPSPATPRMPENPTVHKQVLVKEYYGRLELNKSQPFFPVQIPASDRSGCYLLEYRLNQDGFNTDLEANIDLFLLNHSYEQYKNFVNPGQNCLFSVCVDAPRPAFDDDWLAENYAATELDGDAIYKRVLIPNDSYHLIIDGTSAPDLTETGKDTASADLEVSLRLTEYSYEKAEKLAIQTVGSLVDELPKDWRSSISDLRTTAQEICSSDGVETASQIDIEDLEENSTKIEGISSAAADILSVLESRYSVSLPEEPLRSLSDAARWGGKHLPIIGSVVQVAKSACDLGSISDDVGVSKLKSKAKSFFVSLALLAADLTMCWWGVTYRIAYSLTSATSYLLGYLRQIVGLRFFVVVLKNTLFLFETGISEIVEEIYRISERIAENSELISSKDLNTLLELDGDNVADWRQLAFLNGSNECGAVISTSS